MVSAVLDGRKTVTRRTGATWATVQLGTRLWVREAWNVRGLAYGMRPRDAARIAASDAWVYRTTPPERWIGGWKPRPPREEAQAQGRGEGPPDAAEPEVSLVESADPSVYRRPWWAVAAAVARIGWDVAVLDSDAVGQIRRDPDKRRAGRLVRIVRLGVARVYWPDSPTAALVERVMPPNLFPNTGGRLSRILIRRLERWPLVETT
jgi:hypothetical protein